MLRAETVTLIGEAPTAHGIFDSYTPTNRTVYCTVRSVGMRESYEARSAGLSPELVLIIPHAFEYQDEKLCTMGGVTYKVIRTYVTDTNGIELTVERMGGNAI